MKERGGKGGPRRAGRKGKQVAEEKQKGMKSKGRVKECEKRKGRDGGRKRSEKRKEEEEKEEEKSNTEKRVRGSMKDGRKGGRGVKE